MFHSSQREGVLKEERKILTLFELWMLVKVQVSMLILISEAKNKIKIRNSLQEFLKFKLASMSVFC